MRSFDILQIEEYNRVITSHLADVNFCNHSLNKVNLLKEGINKNINFHNRKYGLFICQIS